MITPCAHVKKDGTKWLAACDEHNWEESYKTRRTAESKVADHCYQVSRMEAWNDPEQGWMRRKA